MATTIRDVAKLAGTSVGAVSAVLNAPGRHNIRVGQETRARIVAAAAQLKYQPNRIAQSLATRKTGALGFVLPYPQAFIDNNPFCSQVMTGVFEQMIHETYDLMLHTALGNIYSAEEEYTLLTGRVDGLILVLPSVENSILERCQRAEFPYVAVVFEASSPNVYTINADEFTGGRLATEHLLSLGHTRIAHLAGNPQVATTEPRKRGYRTTLKNAGVKADPDLIVSAGFDWIDGYAATEKLLALPSARRPTAIFAANDLCAHGVLLRLQEQGVRVPEDMALVGYDDSWLATLTQPPLTSVHMPIKEMGKRAAAMLIAVVEGREVMEKQPVLPVSLSIRASSGLQSAARFIHSDGLSPLSNTKEKSLC